MSAENYVYKKEVDWSLFNYGLNIPIQHQVKFKQIAGRFIERGESKPITLYLNGSSYKARLNNLKIDAKYGNHADMVQICILRSTASADAFNVGRYAEHNGRLIHVTARSLVESQLCNAWLLVS